jgi:Ricin-type beta-trefoil lectin domain
MRLRRKMMLAFGGTLAAAGLVLTAALPATADPLPLAFQIRGGHLGGSDACATAGSSGVTQQVCNALDLNQKWIYNPLTQQLTSGNVAALGKCLSADGADNVILQTCDASNASQRWERRSFTDRYWGPAETLWNIGRDHATARTYDAYALLTGPFLPQVGTSDYDFPLL